MTPRSWAGGRRALRGGLLAALSVGAVGASASAAPAAHAVPTAVELESSVRALHGPVRSLDAGRAVVPMRERVRGAEQLPADVVFGFDRAVVRPAGVRALRSFDTHGRRRGTLRVVGHTDAVGGERYNAALSLRRARAVAAVLRGRTPAGIRVVAVGRGSAAPLAPETTSAGDDDPAARARNRRVELRWSGR